VPRAHESPSRDRDDGELALVQDGRKVPETVVGCVEVIGEPCNRRLGAAWTI
jgi:hypothetical protein